MGPNGEFEDGDKWQTIQETFNTDKVLVTVSEDEQWFEEVAWTTYDIKGQMEYVVNIIKRNYNTRWVDKDVWAQYIETKKKLDELDYQIGQIRVVSLKLEAPN